MVCSDKTGACMFQGTVAIVNLLIDRTARLMLVLALLPAVVLGTVSVEAMLIHDHHGHDLHAHSLPLDEVNDWRNNPEHGHEDHEHDGLPEEPPDDDGSTVVVVLELPHALLRVRGLSASEPGRPRPGRPARLPLPVAVAPEPVASIPCPTNACPWSAAPNLRAGSMVAGILLTSHALLL